MNMKDLFGKIMGFVVIIITLALAPAINDSNADIVNDNLTNLIGMEAISSFGAPLIILGLLVSGGIFAIAGLRGKLQTAGARDMFTVIGSVILVIVSLSLFTSVIDYTNDLINVSSGFAEVVYGIIPLVIYVGIIAAAGWMQFRTYRKLKGKSKKSRQGAAANY